MDNKGDHILVDDEFNITAIIDWEWAQTTSKAEAFCAPLFLSSFYNGDTALSEHEETFVDVLEKKSRPDLAGMVREGRYQHRITFSVGGDVENDLFCHIFEGLLKLQADHGRQLVTWAQWQVEALAKYGNEKDLVKLIEEDSHRHGATSSFSV